MAVKEKRFQEFPEAQGRVYLTNRNRQSVPDSWSSDAERPIAVRDYQLTTVHVSRITRRSCSGSTAVADNESPYATSH